MLELEGITFLSGIDGGQISFTAIAIASTESELIYIVRHIVLTVLLPFQHSISNCLLNCKPAYSIDIIHSLSVLLSCLHCFIVCVQQWSNGRFLCLSVSVHSYWHGQ